MLSISEHIIYYALANNNMLYLEGGEMLLLGAGVGGHLQKSLSRDQRIT
jgi:hypothetical protein